MGLLLLQRDILLMEHQRVIWHRPQLNSGMFLSESVDVFLWKFCLMCVCVARERVWSSPSFLVYWIPQHQPDHHYQSIERCFPLLLLLLLLIIILYRWYARVSFGISLATSRLDLILVEHDCMRLISVLKKLRTDCWLIDRWLSVFLSLFFIYLSILSVYLCMFGRSMISFSAWSCWWWWWPRQMEVNISNPFFFIFLAMHIRKLHISLQRQLEPSVLSP